jgi:hypothetical protein
MRTEPTRCVASAISRSVETKRAACLADQTYHAVLAAKAYARTYGCALASALPRGLDCLRCGVTGMQRRQLASGVMKVSDMNAQANEHTLITSTTLKTVAQPQFAGFADLPAAEQYRSQHGGWLFKPDAGTVLWFDLTFTPTLIFTHTATHGQNGALL